jgi:hypothetical protein
MRQTTSSATQAVSRTVQELLGDFVLERGHAQLPDAAFDRWAAQLRNVPGAERPRVTEELLALALRFKDAPNGAAARGSFQLFLLAGQLDLERDEPGAGSADQFRRR